MIRIHLLLLCFIAGIAHSQTVNYAKAPNSYIYDLDYAESNNYGGIMIPVKKAYEMWSGYSYLKTDGISIPLPTGEQMASVYWEDVPNLIANVSIVKRATPSDSKIKVKINSSRGKGNAVIVFKIDSTIYWSWHIWVTDDPTKGVTYSQGFETDADLVPTQIKYMDRNLGAVGKSFLGNNWNKSGGLMYEWGRKDPFPPLVHKDGEFYEISGEAGVLRHRQIDPINTIPVQQRLFDEIEKNIQYSVKNPLTYIINTDNTGNWFSKNRYKVAGASPNYITWDLWSDNAKGGNSNANSSSTVLKNESRSYELKSELDPCPNGWRIPSYYGRETQNNNLSFFGKTDWNNDDTNVNLRQLFPTTQNVNLNGIKVYPGLGMDFTNAAGGNRNLGTLPVSGAYVYYPNANSPNAPVGTMFQDNNANGGLWSATFAYDGARLFSMTSDAYRTTTNVGLHAIFNNQTNPTRTGNAVRCMKDPNLLKIGDFVTEYFQNERINYTEGLYNPNSYLLLDEEMVDIPVNKAFSVYNQLLSNQDMPPADVLLAKTLWTTNPNLISRLEILNNSSDIKNSILRVWISPGQKGNAVISLHNRRLDNAVLWSWHIWVPNDDPTAIPITYTTENPIQVPYNFVNPTTSKLPPLTTTFMDRNLGAESSSLNSGQAAGLLYQWGRKDAFPVFSENGNESIWMEAERPKYQASMGNASKGKAVYYEELKEDGFENFFTKKYGEYAGGQEIEVSQVVTNLKYSVANPVSFMYHEGYGEIYNGGNHYGNDLTQLKDWISDERAQAENRWGHADRKSPFDPCPEGWRVPDVSFTYLYTGSKGNSPWYNAYRNDAYGKPGVIQDQWHDLATYYYGTVDGNNGWKFTNPNFPIGNFPKVGIRGELGEKEMSYVRSGVWTASLADLHTGFAIAMQFQGNKMQTGTGVYPQAGMSVRCAKDESRLLGNPANRRQPITLPKEPLTNIFQPTESGLKIYPNPFKDHFFINSNEIAAYEIYDFSGKLVMKGSPENEKPIYPKIPEGVYVLKIFMKNETQFSKKLIKK